MKKPILAMALALTLACGSFLGILPGNDALTAKAAETVSGEDAATQLQTPANARWLNGNSSSEVTEGAIVRLYQPFCDGMESGSRWQIELYLNGELYKTEKFTYPTEVLMCRVMVDGYQTRDGEVVQSPEPGVKEEGMWKFRIRAVSSDGTSYSEWSDFSWECNNTKEAYLAYLASKENSSSDSAGTDSSDEEESDSTDTVTTASGEVLTSSAAVNVTGGTPAIVRTPQSTVTAAAASAVGGLKEGQYVMATIGDSACGELARQAVTNAASSVNGKVASYLEITLDVCNPGGGVDQTVTQLSTPVEFAVAAPADIDGKQYDFAVVRLHGDGKVDILPDLDKDPATITFRTDRFSVYAVIYGEKGAFGGSGKDSVPKTGDSTIPVLPFAAAGAACAAAAIILKKKTQA